MIPITKAMFAEFVGSHTRGAVLRARCLETIVHSVACFFLFAPCWFEDFEEGVDN
jgi:hypothetical protein